MKSSDQTNKVCFSRTTRRMTVPGFAMAIVLVGGGIPGLIPAAQAQVTAAWNQDANGNWSAGANWTAGNAPTGTAGVAYFTNAITANRTVTVDSSPWTIGGLTFTNTDAYGFTITNGTLNALASIVVNTNSVATVASAITGSANLTKTGAGTLVLSGLNNYSGRTYLNAGTTVIDGATISNSGYFDIGAVNSPAVFIFNSGAITANSQFVIGAHGTSSGVQSNGTLQVNGTFFVGGYGEGPGTGTYTQVGGAVTATTGMDFGGGGPNAGVYNLAGGSLTVTSLRKNGSGANTFNFNGGVLKPSASSGTFMQGLTTANVQLGGVLLDTAGFNITIAQPLLHESSLGGTPDGGLTKLGTGVLTLTGVNTYTGPTAISNGVLAVTTTNALPGYKTAGKVTLSSGAGLSVGVGSWSNADISALIGLGVYGNDTLFGFDTTAGNYTYSGQFALPTVAGLVKTGPNVLTLPSSTGIAGSMIVLGGILQADFGTGISSASNVTLTAASLSSISGSITASLGTGAGQITLTPNTASGFSAINTLLTVNLGGVGDPLSWGSAAFNPSAFVLNDTGANTNLTFQNAIALNATRTINVNASVAEINGVISNGSATAGLTKGGAGTLKLSAANTYSGGTTISAGTLALTSGNDRLNTSGAITINAGTLDLGGNTQAMTSGNFAMANGTTLQNGTINYKNASWSPNNNASVTFGAGGGFNCPNRLLLQGAQTLTLASGAGASSFGGDGGANCNFIGVDNVNANAVVVNGGSLNFTNMSAGSGYLRIAANNVLSVGTLTVNNGAVNVGHSMSMGTFYDNSTQAAKGIATLNINGGDTAIGTGFNTAYANGYYGWLYLGNNHASTLSMSTINLNGGTLSLAQLEGGAYGTNTVNFNGGTLKARTNNSSFVNGQTLACNIGAGNAVIDTVGFKVGIDQSLSGIGSLIKQGTGTLVLGGSNTYSGVTSVEAGKLTLSPFGDGNLKLHLDASDTSSLFANADGTVAITGNSQQVGYWGDLSGNNKPAKQTTSANRPTYTNNVADFNGRSALYFDGVNDDITSLLDINSTNIPNMTIVMVYKQLEKSGNAGLWGHDNNGFDRLQLFYNTGFFYQVAGNNAGITVKGMETNKVTLYTAVLKNGVGSGSYVYINGKSDSTTGLPAFTSQENSPYGRNDITFGNIGAGNASFYGKVLIGEVLVFDTALGENARRNVEARLRNKWLGTSDPTNTPVLQASGVAATLSAETLAGLKLRLDASVASSLFTNATGVGAITKAGQPVGYWGDLSGNNMPAIQAALGSRPTYMTNLGIFNNLPVLQFDGANHDITSLLNINASSMPNMTVMMVYRQVTYKTSGGLWGHDNGAWDRLQLLNFQSLASNNIAGNNNSILVKGMNTNSVLVYTAVLKNGVASGSYVYINGVSDANTGLPAFTSSEGTGLSSLTIGAIAPGSYRGNIQIGEVLVFDAALSDAARTNAEAYLRDKWTVAFPGRVNVANGAVLDLDGASQTLTSVSGAGTISNGTLTVSEPLSPAGGAIGTLKVSDMAFNATLLVNVAMDGSCDQLVGSGNLNLSGLTLQIANTNLLNWQRSYTLVTCSGSLTGELTASLPTNWKIRYDRTVGTATLVYVPPGTMLRFR